MDENELRQAIEQSRIPSGDTRSERERNAYADWQDKNRRYYNERLYFEQAKLRLGPSMPYKDIGAFRRSYHAREGSFAHERSHNLIRDYEKYIEYKDVLKFDPDFPKTLAKFQEIKYNENENYELLKEFKTYKEEGGNNSFRGYRTAKKLTELFVNGKINIPPLKVDISVLKFDDSHINKEREHHVTVQEAKLFISQAKVSVTVWKGKYEKYYSPEGVVYLDKETMTVRTAFKKDESDERTKKIIEEAEKDE